MTTYEEWRVTGRFFEMGPFEALYTPPQDGDAEARARECAAWARTQHMADGPHLHKRTREHWRAIYEPDFHTNDLDAMLAHIADHRAAGHVVPDWVDQRLRDEWEAEA